MSDIMHWPRAPRLNNSQFDLTRIGERLNVVVRDGLIIGNRQEFQQRLLEELANGARDCIVDFRQATYIDSSGLGVIVTCSKRFTEAGGRFRVCGLHDDLKTLFELTCLDRVIEVIDTEGKLAS